MQRIVQKRAKYEPHLRNAPILKNVDEQMRAMIADEIHDHHFAAGDSIIAQGEAASSFFIVVDGTAAAQVGGSEVRRYGPGDYFGEVALMWQTPRTATVVAVTECECVSFARGAFQRLMRSVFPELERQASQYLSQDFQRAFGQ